MTTKDDDPLAWSEGRTPADYRRIRRRALVAFIRLARAKGSWPAADFARRAHKAWEAGNEQAYQWLIAEARAALSAARIAELRPLASRGELFMKGTPERSPFRAPIAAQLARDATMKPLAIWRAITSSPPIGWRLYERPKPIGRYAEGPDPAADKMGYARFLELVADEREKVGG